MRYTAKIHATAAMPANRGPSFYTVYCCPYRIGGGLARQHGAASESYRHGEYDLKLTGDRPGVINQWSPNALSKFYAKCTITTPAAAGLADGDFFSLHTGERLITYEFDTGGAVTPGRIAIDISTAVTDAEVATAIAAALNGTGSGGLWYAIATGATVDVYNRTIAGTRGTVGAYVEMIAGFTITDWDAEETYEAVALRWGKSRAFGSFLAAAEAEVEPQ